MAGIRLFRRPLRHVRSSGGGRSVSIRVADEHPDILKCDIQMKITSEDVRKGQLISRIEEEVNTRGGKYIISFDIPHELAFLLKDCLQGALKDSRGRRISARIFDSLFSIRGRSNITNASTSKRVN